jgi:dolichyl-diphosphooligosaccharide--protein glycosyltransferase
MDAREVRELLDDRPDLETALKAVRTVDSETESWEFGDVPVDSGAFGELVGAGIVESVGDEYRLADTEAVETALTGETPDSSVADSDGVGFSLPAIDRTAAVSLAVLLVVTVGFRLTTYTSVFRDRVVYPANDPYYYVYHVEEGLRNGWSLSDLPGAVDEPLTTTIMLAAAELAGGFGPHNVVLALLPILTAVVTAVLLYLFACEVTGDRRIALASVLVLAVLPIHVARSGVGFVDHHAFDYPWLVLSAWGLTATFDIETLDIEWPTVRAVVLLAVGIAGSLLAWWAAALLLVPIAIAVVVAGALAVRDDEPFLPAGLGTGVGVGVGAAIVVLAHLLLGWHDTVVVAVPVLLTVGVVGVVGATAVWRRFGWSTWTLPATGIGGSVVVAVAVSLLAPSIWARITGQFSRLFGTGGISETDSLFSGSTMGWLFLFGLLLVVSLPAMAWATHRVFRGDRRWLAPTSYGVYLLGLGAIQLRYGGELAPFVALFAGLFVVALAEWVDAVRSPMPFGDGESRLSVPDRQNVIRLAFIVVLVCGLSAIQAPIVANDLTIPEEQYETASFIDGHAEAAGYDHPDSYVFSPWSWNRMYNYYVNGEAQSYGYAQRNYRPFTLSESPEKAHQQYLRGETYLVTEPIPGAPEISPETMQTRLHDRYGSSGDGVGGLAHYRALYASPEGTYKAFRIVPGGTIEGSASPGSAVNITTDIDIEGDSFTYRRQATAGPNGEYNVTVPYPGEYDIQGGGAQSVTVNETAVANGLNVTA